MPTTKVKIRKKRRSAPQARGIARRHQLIQATYELLCEEDLDQITFSRIAKRADVPEGSAYHFFKNRLEVFLAVEKQIAGDFHDALAAPIDPAIITSWHDILNTVINRSVIVYNTNVAYQRLLLSGKTPKEIRIVDREGNRVLSNILHEHFNVHFQLPFITNVQHKFYLLVELIDHMLSVSYIESGSITDEMITEVKLMAEAYLGVYLPKVVVKRV